MSGLPTHWYNTLEFWIGWSRVLASSYVDCTPYRLPPLGDEGGIEVLLSPAILSLAPGITCRRAWFGKGKERLSRACGSSSCDVVAYRVRHTLLSTSGI
jgi:hypothetical protein